MFRTGLHGRPQGERGWVKRETLAVLQLRKRGTSDGSTLVAQPRPRGLDLRKNE